MKEVFYKMNHFFENHALGFFIEISTFQIRHEIISPLYGWIFCEF